MPPAGRYRLDIEVYEASKLDGSHPKYQVDVTMGHPMLNMSAESVLRCRSHSLPLFCADQRIPCTGADSSRGRTPMGDLPFSQHRQERAQRRYGSCLLLTSAAPSSSSRARPAGLTYLPFSPRSVPFLLKKSIVLDNLPLPPRR